MTKVVKIGSKTCGSCGKMTHYDEKVTKELGYEWLNLEKGTEAYKYATDILNEVRKFFGRGIAFPTYAIYEGDKLVHAFMGATDKGTFRKRIQRETVSSKASKIGDERCEPDVYDVEISSGKICPKGNGEVVTFTVKTSCCEPNNGRFQIDAGDGKKDMRNMAGVSFPNEGQAGNDHGEGEELKDVRIHCDEFQYDIKDHDWIIYWDGDCDQSPGASYDIDHKFEATDSCDEGGVEPEPTPPPPEPPSEPCNGECPPGTVCNEATNTCEWVAVERNIIPACFQFQCCQNKCEEGRPDGNIDIGDGDGDGLGDCDKRPTPEPVPGSNSKNQTYLYDRLNHTFIFCCPIKADVTWLLPFDTMPPVFQRYVTTTASVRVAAQMVNNPQLFQLLKDRENTLRMECMNYELEQGDLNFLNQPDHSTYMSYQTMQTLNR